MRGRSTKLRNQFPMWLEKSHFFHQTLKCLVRLSYVFDMIDISSLFLFTAKETSIFTLVHIIDRLKAFACPNEQRRVYTRCSQCVFRIALRF